MASDLRDRIGPTLRALSGIGESDTQEEIRRRLIAYLDGLAARLPEDLCIALSAGLALHEDVRHRFLDARMQWLADRLQRDIRTARRRVDEAIRSAEAISAAATAPASHYAPGGWYLARFRAVVLLEGGRPSAFEERRIVSTADGLTEMLISTSEPGARETGVGEHPAGLAMLYGASLAHPEPTAGYFLRLPRPLRCGESHDIGVFVTIPASQPVTTRYSFQPLRRCDEFDLRVRFGPASRPVSVWNMDGIPREMAEGFRDSGALLQLDAAGEIHVLYRHLSIGLVYGMRWEGADCAE
jgi:hypothetical protein